MFVAGQSRLAKWEKLPDMFGRGARISRSIDSGWVNPDFLNSGGMRAMDESRGRNKLVGSTGPRALDRKAAEASTRERTEVGAVGTDALGWHLWQTADGDRETGVAFWDEAG